MYDFIQNDDRYAKCAISWPSQKQANDSLDAFTKEVMALREKYGVESYWLYAQALFSTTDGDGVEVPMVVRFRAYEGDRAKVLASASEVLCADLYAWDLYCLALNEERV